MSDFYDFLGEQEREQLLYFNIEDCNMNQEVELIVEPTFEVAYNESGFGVYAFIDSEGNESTIKGFFAMRLTISRQYKVAGKIAKFRGNKQVAVETLENITPIGRLGIIKYLQTLKGLKTRAENIYEMYGEKSIEILTNSPKRVAKEVDGVGIISANKWSKQLKSEFEDRDTIVRLLSYGLTELQSKKLIKEYEDTVLTVIEGNPYVLAREIKGFGFKSCDKIALTMGFEFNSPHRIQEAILFSLEQSTNEGHCFLPKEELLERCDYLSALRIEFNSMEEILRKEKNNATIKYETHGREYDVSYQELRDMYENLQLLKKTNFQQFLIQMKEGLTLERCKYDLLENNLDDLVLARTLIKDDERFYLKNYFFAERRVVENIERLATDSISIDWDGNGYLTSYCESKGIELEEKQTLAVREMSSSKGGFFVLNGSAGRGKTFTLKVILDMLTQAYRTTNTTLAVDIFAPTGRASKVASKATGRECKTIHRGLKFNPSVDGGFEYNESNKLITDVLVIDETSMLDILLADSLFKAIASGTKVILVGDYKQLESVGAGNVFMDIINSDKIKTITLDVPKRQNLLSGINRNANRIIDYQMIETNKDGDDAYLMLSDTSMAVQDKLLKSFDRLLVKGYDFEDIQVLSPMKKGIVGVDYLNYLLQNKFNKSVGDEILNKVINIKICEDDKETTPTKLMFKTGDKVIHIQNNYDAIWYDKANGEFTQQLDSKKAPKTVITNGECGIIESISKNEVIVRYEQGYMKYAKGEKEATVAKLEELDHAYTLTIHKSQGSQWKAILMPICNEATILLNNNLFYTGYTRAEEFIAVIGQPKAISRAIKNVENRKRYTYLRELLEQKIK